MKTILVALACALVCGACSDRGGSATDGASAAALEQGAPPAAGPNLRNQYVLYYGNRAVQEIVLRTDNTFSLLDTMDVFSGTWAFDLPTNTLTLTPAANTAAPPTTVYSVVREDCDPQGWFPTLTNGNHRYVPFGIDPEFEKQYCHVFNHDG